MGIVCVCLCASTCASLDAFARTCVRAYELCRLRMAGLLSIASSEYDIPLLSRGYILRVSYCSNCMDFKEKKARILFAAICRHALWAHFFLSSFILLPAHHEAV